MGVAQALADVVADSHASTLLGDASMSTSKRALLLAGALVHAAGIARLVPSLVMRARAAAIASTPSASRELLAALGVRADAAGVMRARVLLLVVVVVANIECTDLPSLLSATALQTELIPGDDALSTVNDLRQVRCVSYIVWCD
jgi:hypothetical protein